MADPSPCTGCSFTARDRAAMLALLVSPARHRRQPAVLRRRSRSHRGVRPAGRVAEPEADGARVEIVADKTATNGARQQQVGRRNRFSPAIRCRTGSGAKSAPRCILTSTKSTPRSSTSLLDVLLDLLAHHAAEHHVRDAHSHALRLGGGAAGSRDCVTIIGGDTRASGELRDPRRLRRRLARSE